MDPLAVFVECDGLIPLALEKLNRPICDSYPSKCTHAPEHNLITANDLTLSLAQRLPELQDLTRAKILMAAYAASQMAIAAACSKLGALEPFEASKTATNFMDKLAELTKKPDDRSINLNQLIWNQLPDEEAREAWLFITQGNKPKQINTKYDWQLPDPRVIEHDVRDQHQ